MQAVKMLERNQVGSTDALTELARDAHVELAGRALTGRYSANGFVGDVVVGAENRRLRWPLHGGH